MSISIIVAIAENNAIGKDNRLLWHIPGDLKRFKKITSGHTVIMGKRTYESLPLRPLPNRTNIVITDVPGELIPGCLMAYSIEDAMNICNKDEENFVIGGESVYRQFLPLADKLYLTVIRKPFEADAFFPEINFDEWKLIEKTDIETDPETDFLYSYLIYSR